VPIPGWPDQGVAFDAAVHLGTAGALLFAFAPTLWRLAGRALAGRASERRLGLALVLGIGPAALAGVRALRAGHRDPAPVGRTGSTSPVLLGVRVDSLMS